MSPKIKMKDIHDERDDDTIELSGEELKEILADDDFDSSEMNDGLFSLMVRGGKMKGVFVGHDHINDFEGTLHGIRLCYGRGSGYQCYGLEGYPHGARIIDLSPDGTFSTKIWLETGELYTQTRRHVHKLNCKG